MQKTNINNYLNINNKNVTVKININYLIKFNNKGNKKVNKLFLTIQIGLILVSNLIDVYF